MSDEKKGVMAIVAVVVVVLVLIVSFVKKDDVDNKWGSKYGNENIRVGIRDEMIRNGTDPTLADIYTKREYEEERQRNKSK